MYEIYYEQTGIERYGHEDQDYDTLMNSRVRKVLEDAGVDIVEEWGGAWITHDPDSVCAENSFTVDASLDTLNRLLGAIQDIVGRDVRVSEIDV